MEKFQQQVTDNPEIKQKLVSPKNINDYFIPELPKRKVILEPIKKLRLKTIL